MAQGQINNEDNVTKGCWRKTSKQTLINENNFRIDYSDVKIVT